MISAVCAEAEGSGASGRDVLAAFAVGTEVSVKLSHTIDKQHYLRGFHMTSTCGVFGATAGVCNLRRFSHDETLRAIGIAGSKSSGVRENFGTMVKPLHSGIAAENAVVAASLAAMGFTSSPTILEGNRGYFMTGAGGYDAEALIGKLGNPWNYVAKRVAIKPYPCGNLQQPAMDKLRELVLQQDIRPHQLEHLAVKSHRLMPLNLTYHRPTTGLESKFSMEFSLASILVLRKAGLAEYSDEVVNRADIQDVIRKTDYTVFSDEEAEAKGYHLWTTFLDLTLKDGRTISARVDAAKGSADYPMNEEEVAEKFRDCAAFAKMPEEPRREGHRSRSESREGRRHTRADERSAEMTSGSIFRLCARILPGHSEQELDAYVPEESKTSRSRRVCRRRKRAGPGKEADALRSDHP